MSIGRMVEFAFVLTVIYWAATAGLLMMTWLIGAAAVAIARSGYKLAGYLYGDRSPKLFVDGAPVGPDGKISLDPRDS